MADIQTMVSDLVSAAKDETRAHHGLTPTDIQEAIEHRRRVENALLVVIRSHENDHERLDWLQRRCSVLEMEGEEGVVVKLEYLESDNDGENVSLPLPLGAEWPNLRNAIDAARELVPVGTNRDQPVSTLAIRRSSSTENTNG